MARPTAHNGQTALQSLLRISDRLSTAVGCAFGWLIVLMVALIVFEVVSRYAFRMPHAWVLDASIMSFGALFMMGGAYTLAKQNHVRGDILYGMLQPRTQATIDLVLYVVFFCPGLVALIWAGYDYAADSWAIGERSALTAEGSPVYPFKTLIPIAGVLLLMQGVAEMLRCVVCLRTGEWASREPDVQEVDVDKLKAQLSGVPSTDGSRP